MLLRYNRTFNIKYLRNEKKTHQILFDYIKTKLDNRKIVSKKIGVSIQLKNSIL